MRRVATPNRGGAVTQLTVPHPAGDTLYATREVVESQGAAAIETRYKVAQGAPILQDAQLHGEFWISGKHGFGRSGLAELICLPREYGYTYQTSVTGGTTHLPHTVDGKVMDFVSTTDFQSYWRHANEDIQSSKSGCHFGHYKAASYNQYLLALHAAKLTLATSTGVPLAHWGMDSRFSLRRHSGTFT